MKRFLFAFIGFIFFLGCDDGDVITVELDFDKSLNICDNNNDSFYVFDLKRDPSESIGVILPKSDSLLFQEPTTPGEPVVRNINESSIRFIYRTYNRDISDGDNGELCDLVPAFDLVIQEDYEAPTGQIIITTTIEDDDQDGIPTIFEDDNSDGDNDPETNPVDTDMDGIPNYRDKDDDGDNVPTINELDNNTDGDDNPETNPLDTDDDGIPNYRDKDDDGDGIDTIFEDEDQDQNPRNDTNPDADDPLLPHYLNNLELINYGNPGPNQDFDWIGFIRVVTTNFLVQDFDLEIIRGDEYNLGDIINELNQTNN